MEENVWRQKFQAGRDVKEKRRLMMEESYAKRTVPRPESHGASTDDEPLTTGSHRGQALSQTIQARGDSPDADGLLDAEHGYLHR